jgi:hypothetical protein
MRTVSAVLVFLVLAATPAVQAQLSYTTNADGITLTITGYSGTPSVGPLNIPSNIYGLTVVNIGNGAFAGPSDGLGTVIEMYPTSVTIPNTITNIGGGAFFSCAGLTNITIPDTVLSIGENAFLNSGLLNIIIPDSVTNIGDWAFWNCYLTNATIGNGVTSIGRGVFGKNNMTGVTIPGSVTNIGVQAFMYCFDLKNVTMGNSVTNIADQAFYDCISLIAIYFEGNAPSLGSSVFSYDPNLTFYYLPGTTGWASLAQLTGAPTVFWNPSIQSSNPNFGVKNNVFGFTITCTNNIPIVVAATTNLAGGAWTPLQTLTLTNGSVYFGDPQWTNYPCRFYGLSFP